MTSNYGYGYRKRRTTTRKRAELLPFETRETQLRYREEGLSEWNNVEGVAMHNPDTNRIVHTVELSGLIADKGYEFNLPTGDNPTVYITWKYNPSTSVVIHWHTITPFPSWGFMGSFSSEIHKFKTVATTLDDSFRVIQISDTHGRAGNDEMLRNVTDYNPDVVIHSGDVATGNGGELTPDSWYVFFDAINHLRNSDGYIIPLLPNLGNHDVWGGQSGVHYGVNSGKKPNFETGERGDSEWYYTFFPSFIDRGYGVFDCGDYLSIWQMNPGITEYVDRGQDTWLQDTLDTRTNIPHKLLSMHYSPYPTGRRELVNYNLIPRAIWCPIYEPHKPLVLVGHEHVWSKTVPIKDGAEHPDGVVYVGSGPAGERGRPGRNPHTTWWVELSKAESWDRFPFESDPNHPEYREPHEADGTTFDYMREVNHFWMVDVSYEKRVVTAVDFDKNVIHSFEQLATS